MNSPHFLRRYQTGLWTTTRLLLIGIHLIYGMLQIAALYPLLGIQRREWLKQCWSRQLLRLLGVRIDTTMDEIPASTDIRQGLLVCNHISFIDIFVINALLPCGFVAKSDVADWPVIGWLSRYTDTVFIERGNRRAAHQTQARMQSALSSGRRLAMFPEGTTSAGTEVLPFHAALMQSAVDAEATVHVLTLSYHDPLGSRCDTPAYIEDISLLDCILNTLRSDGITARISFTTRFDPPHADRRQLAHQSRQAIAARLHRHTQTSPAQTICNAIAISQ